MELIEREDELARLETVVKEGASGRGGTVVIEGPPGIGKTALLDRACALAGEVGMGVLSATAVELESDLGFSVIRSMFEPVLAALDLDERGTLLDGAARLAKGPLGLRNGTEPVPIELGSAVHGIYWFCANFADREPMLLAIDDLHWADEASLFFLSYLARRVREHPLVICATMRPSEHEPAERFLSALLSESDEVLHPAPLSGDGVAEVVTQVFSGPAAPEFSDACAQATGGNPFLLSEVLTAFRHDGVKPTADGAGRIAELRPATLSRSLLSRLARLRPDANRVADAVAILGTDADLRCVALIADLEQRQVADAISGLRREGFLAPNAHLEFAHPLIRTAVYSGISEPGRGLLHLRAAKILDEGDGPRVASHLLVAPSNRDQWVVDRLRDAAIAALAIGAPSSAAALLERALVEPANDAERPTLGLELGRALAQGGRLDAACDALQTALDLVDEPVRRAEIAIELGRTFRLRGRIPEAVAILDRAVKDLPDGHHDEATTLEMEIAAAGHMGLPAREWVDRFASVAEQAHGMSLSERTMRGYYAYIAASTGTRDATDVARLARSSNTPAGEFDPPFVLQGVASGLAMSGSFFEALDILDRALEISQELGDAVQFGFVSTTRAWVAHRAGRVLEGEADARAVLASDWDNALYRSYAAAQLVIALIERSALDEANNLLSEHGLAKTTDLQSLPGAVIYLARGRLHRVCGRLRDAVADFNRCRDVLDQVGFTGPSFGEWRMDGALSHLALGHRDLARDIATEDLELSHEFGAPRELGIALRTRGLVEGGPLGLGLLSDSVDVLAGSEAVLDHAKSLVEHGAALRRAGRRADAPDRLSRGLDLASKCGALATATRARDELIAAGARPRRERLTGPDSLTASELRVARLAAEGRSNPEIAQALFVTRRTVEVHLTHVYRKLAIESRDALAAVLLSET